MNKLRISLSFDDGRSDNYYNVLKIINKYNLNATIHVISGYIDGSYAKGIASSPGACTIEQLRIMGKNGFEISLHGDQHTTSVEDYNNCIQKMSTWGLLNDNYGFSIPYSDEKKIDDNFLENIKNTNTVYIRSGKNNKKITNKHKVYYLLSNIFSSAYFFYKYNSINIIDYANLNPYLLNSIVVKKNTTLRMLKYLINKNIDSDKWIIFMFHSVLDKNDNLYKESEWAWSLDRFEELCIYLNYLVTHEKAIVKPIINFVR